MARQTVPVIGVPVPAPRHLHKVPWKRIALWTIVLIVLAVVALGARELVSRVTSGNAPVAQTGQQVQVGPAPVVNPPAQTEPEAAVPAVPREIEVSWVLLGTGKPVTETMNRLGIPWEKWSFMPAAETEQRLNYMEHGGGIGDGTAYLLYSSSFGGVPRADNPALYFTPDQGKTWFKVANPYPGQSITSPEVGGANIEGNNLVLFIQLQPESWVGAWWKAEIPLSQLEGQSP